MLEPWLVAVLLGLPWAMGGTALVIAGWRGRCVDRLPYCRKCRFCLDGLPSTTCPECGRSLERSRGVRLGRRRTRLGLVGVGLLLAVTGVAPVGMLTTQRATGLSLQRIKPMWLLGIEIGSASPLTSREAAVEVSRRIGVAVGGGPSVGDVGGVSSRALDLDAIVRSLLDRQASLDRPFLAEHARVLHDARGAGMVSDEQWRRYLRQSLSIEARVPRRVRAGQQIPLVPSVGVPRFGIEFPDPMASTLGAMMGPVRVTADQRVLLETPELGGGLIHGQAAHVIGTQLFIPAGLPVGTHVLRIEASAWVRDARTPRGDTSDPVRVAVDATVEIVRPEELIADLVPHAGTADALAQGARLQHAVLRVLDDGPAMLTVAVQFPSMPLGVAFEVWFTHGGRRWGPGYLHASPGVPSSMSALVQLGADVVSETMPETIDVELVASDVAAARSTDLEAIWSGRLTFRGVPLVRWVGDRAPFTGANQMIGAEVSP